MFELTPYRHVHPPHLDGYLRSQRGEFQLIALGDGRTRLEGRTWYDFRMFPQSYWTLWSDLLIHRIHQRVLLHIKRLSEAPLESSLQAASSAGTPTIAARRHPPTVFCRTNRGLALRFYHIQFVTIGSLFG